MKPLSKEPSRTEDLFRSQLVNIINLRHPLVKLAGLIDWQRLEAHFLPYYADNGRPAHPTRLLVGLHLLKHVEGISDEVVCERWERDPYMQYFCGEEYFQHHPPIARADMTHFRGRVGDEALEILLQETLAAAHRCGALSVKACETVAVDTTVQEKAVAHPTDHGLLLSAIENLGASLATPNDVANDAIKKETGLDFSVLGHLYSGSLKMNGFDVPLPGDHWIMLANIGLNGPKVSGRAYFLGRVVHKCLIEAVKVLATRPKPNNEASAVLSEGVARFNGLAKSEECNSIPLHECWVLYGLFTARWEKWGDRNAKMDGLTRAAIGDMAANGISYPQDFLIVEFMTADKKGYLEASYFLA